MVNLESFYQAVLPMNNVTIAIAVSIYQYVLTENFLIAYSPKLPITRRSGVSTSIRYAAVASHPNNKNTNPIRILVAALGNSNRTLDHRDAMRTHGSKGAQSQAGFTAAATTSQVMASMARML